MLADGIPINDAWGEWIDWGRVPKAMLDRVEVVEGGTSNLYGNGAMGGAISFFTRPLAPGAMDMQVDGGNRGSKHAFIGGGIPLIGALSANVSGDYQEKGGYVMIDESDPGFARHHHVADLPAQSLRAAELRAVVQLVGVRRWSLLRRLAQSRHAALVRQPRPARPLARRRTTARIPLACSASARGTAARSSRSARRRSARRRRVRWKTRASPRRFRAMIGAVRRCGRAPACRASSNRSASAATSGTIRATSTKSTSIRAAAPPRRPERPATRWRATCRRAARRA